MKSYWVGVKAWLHGFLISAVGSTASCFTSWEMRAGTHSVGGWMGRRGCDGENANSREPQLLQHAERSLRLRSATLTSIYCLRDFWTFRSRDRLTVLKNNAFLNNSFRISIYRYNSAKYIYLQKETILTNYHGFSIHRLVQNSRTLTCFYFQWLGSCFSGDVYRDEDV